MINSKKVESFICSWMLGNGFAVGWDGELREHFLLAQTYKPFSMRAFMAAYAASISLFNEAASVLAPGLSFT